jgi:hypothetical protein
MKSDVLMALIGFGALTLAMWASELILKRWRKS